MMNDPLMVKKSKVLMVHPYAVKNWSMDRSLKIGVEVEGEYYNGLPHGLCFMWYKYNGELGPAKS